MTKESDEAPKKRDWGISLTLLAVWLVAVVVIRSRDKDIPSSMLIIASVFFVLLIPAMNDVVRSIERRFARFPNKKRD
jgi:multisubunit Na+/H+ antiporter MnhG subunit